MVNRYARPFWILLAVTMVALGAMGAAGNNRRAAVNEGSCAPPTSIQEKWIPAEWQGYLKYVRVCTARDSKGTPAVLLVSVWAKLYYRAQPGSTVEQVRMPHPLLFSPAGDMIGSLPFNFPDDPPVALKVTFTSWQRNFPHRIELFLNDPGALGDRALAPLVWNSDQHKYEQERKHPNG